MEIADIVQQPEGRQIEFNETVPEYLDLAKSVISFANDSGGEIYLGIRSSPREIIGLQEEELFRLRELIINGISDHCYPSVLPDISFLSKNDRHIIRIKIHKGNTPPYYLKDTGKNQGTYIRIGPSNRLADENAIAGLERKKKNVSFDCELITDKLVGKLEIQPFCEIYKAKTGEHPDIRFLRKNHLAGSIQGVDYPTVALVLFSDDKLRSNLFPYAKIVCSRYSEACPENSTEETIDSNLITQADKAYDFVMRHIHNKSADKNSPSRPEYPVRAIKEVLRNAVIHRDYSKEDSIKVTISDNMIEIKSPGLIPASIDYDAVAYRQSDARNRAVAPIFRNLGIASKLGSGLNIISEDLRGYPNIEFKWIELDLSLRIQFIKSNHYNRVKLGHELRLELSKELRREHKSTTLYSLILSGIETKPLSKQEITSALGKKSISGHLNRTISKLLFQNLIEYSIPDNPTHPEQTFRLTERGIVFLELL